MNKILVVDDDLDMLYLVNLVLTDKNYDVKTISNWETITESINTFNPDIVLLDINLGSADGGAICKGLKQSKETRQLPIILYSSAAKSDVYVKACQAQGFLKKPFETINLLSIISSNLNQPNIQLIIPKD